MPLEMAVGNRKVVAWQLALCVPVGQLHHKGVRMNTRHKPWYKKWWGVIIAILILPYFSIWYIWAKKKWHKLFKSVATLAILTVTLLVSLGVALQLATMSPNTPDNADKSTTKPVTLGPLPNLNDTTTEDYNPTNNFAVTAGWGIIWNYDCTSVSPQPGVFDITVQDPDGTYSAKADSITTNGVKGSGVQKESQAGTFQLAINTDAGCTWHIQVVNNSSPTTISDAPAPAKKQSSRPQNTSPAKYDVYPQGGTPTTDATVWANDGSAQVVNPADLRLYGEVKNTGGKSGTPSCTIQAHDDSYSYHGTDIVTRTSPLNPGGVWDWKDDITITSQGAQYVTQIEVSCQNS